MTASQRYIVHSTGYERDDYILKTLLRDAPEALPLTKLRRTTWQVCEVPLDELENVELVARSPADQALIQRWVEKLSRGQTIPPVLVLGPEKRLLAGHRHVQALAALGEKSVLAYLGEEI